MGTMRPVCGLAVTLLAVVLAIPAPADAAGAGALEGTRSAFPLHSKGTGPTPALAVSKVRASVSAELVIQASGDALLSITSNAKKVQVKYRTAGARKRSRTVKMRQGGRQLLLPPGANSVKVRAKATKHLARSRWVRVYPAASPVPAVPGTPSVPATPSPAPSSPGPSSSVPTVSGQVTFELTGQPYPGAIVECRNVLGGNLHTTTDANGFYSMPLSVDVYNCFALDLNDFNAGFKVVGRTDGVISVPPSAVVNFVSYPIA